jgi:4-amino-4-deoxy-L-arabinose transferase-like glycosyltransferase
MLRAASAPMCTPMPSSLALDPAPLTAQQRRHFWLFMLVALIVLSAGIGLRDPWPSDEPRFALVAKHMVESGDWLFTHRGSELYSDKPPAFMQMQAAAYTLTGHWRIAFLLPSLLAALGTLFLIHDLGRRLWNPRVGLWAAAALLATFQFAYQSKRAQIDPVVTFFITAANYGLLRHFLLGPDWRAWWLGCFAAGLGVITKGVGVLALLMIIPYVFARRAHWQHVTTTRDSAWPWAGGALAFLAAIGVWLVPMLASVLSDGTPEQHAYMHDILFRQTAGRYAGSWSHEQPAWYFAEVIAFAWLPLSLALVPAVPHWRHALKVRDARFLLPLGWVVLVLVFFSVSRGKRDVYILPALPWIALMLAPFLDDIVARPWFRRSVLLFVVVLSALFAGVGIAAWLGRVPRADALVEARGFGDAGRALWAMFATIGVVGLLAALAFRVRRALHALAATLVALWLAWGLVAYPLLNEANSSRGLMRQAADVAGANGEIALVAWKEQNLLFADRPVADFGFRTEWHEQLAAAIRWQEAAPAQRWVFAQQPAIEGCVDMAAATVLGNANRRRWVMFRSDAVRPACRGGNVPRDGVGEQTSADDDVD